ncbi:hypothetical protein ANN_27044 [Periplaneta americana]|uniref:PiggyBac transposable element-derived protein domain-containing protein n=1 Tax=Periplaneta americana TaxID=6978 RepID=A0ABQ8RX23_PERAM|nr:hypothetical protein ANN_27044 [Periplaneta americana]
MPSTWPGIEPATLGIEGQRYTNLPTRWTPHYYDSDGVDEDVKQPNDDSLNLYGKNACKWSATEPNRNRRTPAHNIVMKVPTLKADNYFTSMELVSALKERKLTYVGTMQKNEKDIPQEFQADRKRKAGSTEYEFQNDRTLISHVPKKGKFVILLSSRHHSVDTDPETGKPEIISFYNSTKGGSR